MKLMVLCRPTRHKKPSGPWGANCILSGRESHPIQIVYGYEIHKVQDFLFLNKKIKVQDCIFSLICFRLLLSVCLVGLVSNRAPFSITDIFIGPLYLFSPRPWVADGLHLQWMKFRARPLHFIELPVEIPNMEKNWDMLQLCRSLRWSSGDQITEIFHANYTTHGSSLTGSWMRSTGLGLSCRFRHLRERTHACMGPIQYSK